MPVFMLEVNILRLLAVFVSGFPSSNCLPCIISFLAILMIHINSHLVDCDPPGKKSEKKSSQHVQFTLKVEIFCLLGNY